MQDGVVIINGETITGGVAAHPVTEKSTSGLNPFGHY